MIGKVTFLKSKRMHRLVTFLCLAVVVAHATKTVYYPSALQPVPHGCTVYGQRATVCHLNDSQVAPKTGGYEGFDEPLIAPSDTGGEVSPQAVAQSWGQDRVDQRTLPLDGQYNPDRTGNGATIWVVSSGVDASVGQISGRATNPFTTSQPATDCNGQGTEVAVTAGGSTFGIASAPFIRGIKVLDCNGDGGTSNLVDGLSYILANPQSRNVVLIAVSFIGRNSAVEKVIEDLLADDMTVIAGAGDQATSACQFFPAAQDGVISVTSSTPSDKRYSFANYGSCVTMIAPGRDITTKTLSGTTVNRTRTRLAAAHVAGAAAQVLQGSPSLTGAQVLSNLENRATVGEISNTDGTPNLLLFVLQDSNPPQTTTSGSTTGSGAIALSVPFVVITFVATCIL